MRDMVSVMGVTSGGGEKFVKLEDEGAVRSISFADCDMTVIPINTVTEQTIVASGQPSRFYGFWIPTPLRGTLIIKDGATTKFTFPQSYQAGFQSFPGARFAVSLTATLANSADLVNIFTKNV